MFGLNQFGSFNRPMDEADALYYAGGGDNQGRGPGYMDGDSWISTPVNPNEANFVRYAPGVAGWDTPGSQHGIHNYYDAAGNLGGQYDPFIQGGRWIDYGGFSGANATDGGTTNLTAMKALGLANQGTYTESPQTLGYNFFTGQTHANDMADHNNYQPGFDLMGDLIAPAIGAYLTGGALGAGFGAMGMNPLASKALAGGLSSAATGGNPVTGALMGGASGFMGGGAGGQMPAGGLEELAGPAFAEGWNGAGNLGGGSTLPLGVDPSYPTYDSPYDPSYSAPQNTGYNVNPDPYAADQGYTPETYTPQGASGGVKDWLKETNTSLKDTLGMGLGPLVLGGLGLAGGLLGGTSSAQSPAGPAGPTAAQQAYLNRPGVSWDWDAIQAEAAKAGIPVSQLIARGWQNVTGGKYNKPTMARGGVLNMLARGGGTGRSDSIDARLSDGEYVMDAETVAMLGDGSTQAGAQKLDHMREALRKHKGRTMARGRISPDARSPLEYVKGAA